MLALPVERLVGNNHHHRSASSSRSRLSLSPDSSASDTSESIDVESHTSGPDHGHTQSQGHSASCRSDPDSQTGSVCHEGAIEDAISQDSIRGLYPSPRPPIVTCDKVNFPACTDPDDNHLNDKNEANPLTPSVNSCKSLNTQLKNQSKSLPHSLMISNRSGDQGKPPFSKLREDKVAEENPHRCDNTPRLAKNGLSNPEPYYRSNLNCSCKSINRTPATTSSSGSGRRKGLSTKINVPSPPRLLSDSPEKSNDNEVKEDENNRSNKVDISREINRSPPNLLHPSFAVGNGNSCHGINLGTQTEEQQHVIRVKSEMPSPSPQEVDMDERLAKDGSLLHSSSSPSSQSHKLTREEEEEHNQNVPGDNGLSDKVNNGERISNANPNTNCCKNEKNDCPSSCCIQRGNSNSIIKANRIRGSSEKRKTSSSWTSASREEDHRAETSSISRTLVQLEGDIDNNDQSHSKEHDNHMDEDDDNNNERMRQEGTNNSLGNSSNNPKNNHQHHHNSHYHNGDNLATRPPSRPLSTASSTCSSYYNYNNNGKSTNGNGNSSHGHGSSHLKFSIDDILRPDFGLNQNSNSIDIHNNNNNIYNNKGGRYAGQLFNPFFSDTRGNFGHGHHPSTKFYPQHLGSIGSNSSSILCKELPSPSSSISSAATNYNNNHHHSNSNISKARSGSISSTEGFRPCRPSSVKSIGSEDSNCSSGRRIGEEVVDDTKVNPPVPKGPLLWPAWVYCTRYSDRPSSGPRSRRIRKKTPEIPEEKRPRTAFTGEQLSRLKQEFDENRYLTEKRRQDLARDLNLHENQIKIWFQNKRAKLKKSTGTKNGLALQLMAQGLYNHSTVPIDEDDEMEMMM